MYLTVCSSVHIQGWVRSLLGVSVPGFLVTVYVFFIPPKKSLRSGTWGRGYLTVSQRVAEGAGGTAGVNLGRSRRHRRSKSCQGTRRKKYYCGRRFRIKNIVKGTAGPNIWRDCKRNIVEGTAGASCLECIKLSRGWHWQSERENHGRMNYKDTEPYMSAFKKKLTC